MQRLFYVSPGARKATERRPEELGHALAGDGWIWLDVTDPTDSDIAVVEAHFDFDPLCLDDLLDQTLLPKVDDHGAYLFVVLHTVSTLDGQRLHTQKLDLLVGRNFLVTVHKSPMISIDWVAGHAVESSHWVEEGPVRLSAAIAEVGIRRYLPLLDALEKRIDDLDDRAMDGDPHTLGESHVLRRDVIMLRKVLGPQREVLLNLSNTASPLMNESTRRAFSDVYDHHFRLVESFDSARALLASVVDTYRGVVELRTNEVMKVLTVFSAILLPLALIAGIWGMNFGDIPGYELRWGFIGLVAVMAIIAVSLWVYFVRRGFIGGVKLREVPRAVGLGLIHIGAAPLRVVAGLRSHQGRSDESDPSEQSSG
jgi:magnesium transporter